MNGKAEVMNDCFCAQFYRYISCLLTYLLDYGIIVEKRKGICRLVFFMNDIFLWIILTNVIKGEDYVEEEESYLENVFVGHWRTACVLFGGL